MSFLDSLGKIWNRVAFELESREIIAPCTDVQDELRKDGWAFEIVREPLRGGPGFAGGYAMTLPVTPEGRLIIDSSTDGNRYNQALHKACLKVYGPF